MSSLTEVKEILRGIFRGAHARLPGAHSTDAWVEVYLRIVGPRVLTPLEIRQSLTDGKSFGWSLLLHQAINRHDEALPRMSNEDALEAILNVFRSAYHAGPDSTIPWDKVPPQPVLQNVELYPEADDPRFHEVIYWKKEFHHKKSDFRGKTPEEMCRKDRPFELFPYQKFLRNLFSPNTPYQGILLFHATGSGKTPTAITIAEQFRSVMASNSEPQKRALVLVPRNPILDNFVQQLHDPAKTVREKTLGLPQGAMQITGNTYANPVPNFWEDFYDIKVHYSFRNQFLELRKNVLRYLPSDDKELIQEKVREEIRRKFSNRLIIVDEAHNLKYKVSDDEPGADKEFASDPAAAAYNPYAALLEILQTAENVRLVLMTATPVFDKVTEIVDLFNLLLANERRPLLDPKDVFLAGTGDDVDFRTEGRQTLAELSRRYVSYIRGENPITFPRLVEITDPVVKKQMPHLRPYVPKAPRDFVRGQPIPASQRLTDKLVLVECRMSPLEFEAIEDVVRSSKVITDGPGAGIGANNPSGSLIAFPRGTSTAGFYQSFRKVREKGPHGEYQFEYLPEHRGFLKDISKYSCKYSALLPTLAQGRGIHFVSPQYNEAGVYTLAMLLEEHGYENFFGTPYLAGGRLPADQKQCALCSLRQGQHGSTSNHAFVQAKYAMFDREVTGSTQNYHQRVLDAGRSADNLNGERLKVILGSPVTNEGVDFANIRHVHLLSPWWNLSKITQIIGRAIRSCSHIQLPAQDRRVVVYRYCAAPPANTSAERETPDEWMWRTSFVKDRLIKRVERVLKENSIDCYLNKELNRSAVDPNGQDGTRACEYDQCEYKCYFEPRGAKRDLNRDTESRVVEQDQIRQATFYISQLFLRKDVYLLEEIETEIAKIDPQMEKNWIYAALDSLVSHMTGQGSQGMTLYDQHGREGFLQYVRQHYVFLPMAFSPQPRTPLHVRRQVPPSQVQRITLLPPAEYRADTGAGKKKGADVPWLAWSVAAADWWRKQVETQRPGLVHRFLDLASLPVRVALAEMAIEERWFPPVLVAFFRDAWIHRRDGQDTLGWTPSLGTATLGGHLLGPQPRCYDRTAKAWVFCPPMVRALSEHRAHFLKNETFDVHFGYSDENGVFKLVDRDVQKKKVDRIEGKTCKSFRMNRLQDMRAAFGFPPSKAPGVAEQCDEFELLLRERQIEHDVAGRRVRALFSHAQWEHFREMQRKAK